MRFSELSNIVEGAKARVVEDQPITRLVIDSRKVLAVPGAVFFALVGPNHDGHDYLQAVYEQGIRQFVVSGSSQSLPLDCNVLLVSNTLNAAQQIAGYHRRQFDIPVVGITGSNGKTIVKEWLATLLGTEKRVVKSPKSYNSQIGVPLSLWQINEQHEVAIFEAGVSRRGEMQYLAEIITPTIGVFTNIGSAHDDGFANRTEKIYEKLLLFKDSMQMVYCSDHAEIKQIIELAGIEKTLSWSYQGEGDIAVGFEEGVLAFSMPSGEQYHFHPKYADPSSLENLVHCIVVCLSLGLGEEEIQSGMSYIENLQMRLTIKQAENGCYVIDDTYSNDLSAIDVATDFLIQQSQREKKTVILSDILESGIPEGQLYQQVAELLRKKKINRLIGIGEQISQHAHYFNGESQFYPDKEVFLSSGATFADEIILVKGARVFEFERIVNHLARKTHGTVLEVNMEAIAHNLQWYRSKLGPGVKLMVMVKALAYGGSYEVANLLQYHGVDYLGVAYTDEGARLRQNGIQIPIMVMNVKAQDFDTIQRFGLHPEIYTLDQLNQYLASSKPDTSLPPIHLKLETGMNRLGFVEGDLSALTKLLAEAGGQLKVAGIFTHLASAADPTDREFTEGQIEQFIRMSDRVIEVLGYQPIRHALNTAGIVNFADRQLEMVRLGGGLYGMDTDNEAMLKTVSTLKTTISQIKTVRKGETVGYSRAFRAARDSTIATIAIGYADGFRRQLSNGKGKVAVNGHLVPVAGLVCMDMTMIDVTGVPSKVGDEVVIFGERPTVTEMAEWTDTIPYEVMTSIGERVKRVFISE